MNIKDIAKLSGVGVSTVSRVLNHHKDVKESTRKRVLEVIKESNYVPNNSARILKQNNTNNIGVLVMGVFNPLFSEMTNIIGHKINKSKYTMIFEQNNFTMEDDFHTLQSLIKEKRLQGVICLGGNFKKARRVSIESLNVPVVLTSVNTVYENDLKGCSTVGVDNIESSYRATKYLLELRHRDIAIMIGEKKDLGISNKRLLGYKKAIEEAGIPFDQSKILEGDYDTTKAYSVMKDYLSKGNKVTAVFAISDFMAIGIAKAIVDMGFKIGDEISIIGFDGMDVSKFYNPGITTISQPKVKIAETSAEVLLNLIKGTSKHKHLILDTELVKRESCKIWNGKERMDNKWKDLQEY